MGPLAAFLFATPIFGLSLQLDPSYLATQQQALPALSSSVSDLNLIAAEEVADDSGDDAPGSTMAEDIAHRRRMGRIHRAFGIATWGGMTLATVFGIIQYRNLYGGSTAAGTPCGEGTATFGQDSCIGLPAPHLATVILTSALYYTTFGLSYAMPDPLNVSEGDGDYARRLRTHKRLRWVHFAGMAAQILLGVVSSNSDAFGLNRSEDYRALRAISTIHLAIGLTTYGTLTYAGALMVR